MPEEATERLLPVGQWTAKNGEAFYGAVDRADGRMEWMPTGSLVASRATRPTTGATAGPAMSWPSAACRVKVVKASFLVAGAPIAFEQTDNRLILKGLPDAIPDAIAGMTVIKLECDAPPQQVLGAGYVVL